MLYVDAIIFKNNNHFEYYVVEILTAARFSTTESEIAKMHTMGIDVENIDYKHFPSIKKEYKITILDSQRSVIDVDAEVYNARFIRSDCKDISVKTKRAFEVSKAFEESVKEKYSNFIMKTKALGMDCRFEYTLLGKEVILTEYTGKCKTIMMPSFVTVIRSGAFSSLQELGELDLIIGSGVHTVGSSIFLHSKVKSPFIIPETVQFVSESAFRGMSWRDTSFKVKIANPEKTYYGGPLEI